MFDTRKAFCSFSVDDIEVAKKFYTKTLELETRDGLQGTLIISLSTSDRALIYPRPDHKAAAFTVMNFPVDSIETAVDELTRRGVRFEKYNDANLKTDARGISRGNGPTNCMV